MGDTIKIGLSTCLLGKKVRWDGGHAREPFLTDTLGQYVTYVPVCPEVECGMGVPRETIRLEGDPENPRLMSTKTRIDHTQRMNNWARSRVQALEKEDLCGFIFKKKSPSCGLFEVPVWNDEGLSVKNGRGLFARALTHRFPLIPVEEEGRLHDPKLREMFVEQIVALAGGTQASRSGMIDGVKTLLSV